MAAPLSDVEEYIQFGTPGTTQQDCAFLEDLVRGAGRKGAALLDLACGTGRHALEMARRGFETTGVDVSAERILFAQNEARKLGLTNCRFIRCDLRELHLPAGYGWAYSFFNTFSLFTDNDDLLRILRRTRSSLEEGGRLVIHLGSLWAYIAEGTFRDNRHEGTINRGSLIRKEEGITRISRINNLYRHDRVVQYIRDGVEYPPEEQPVLQRIFSINEWDLLCRLSGFRIDRVFSAMDVSHEILDYTDCGSAGTDHEIVLVLAR